MNLEQFRGKKIALVGFGIENISVAKFLLNKKIDFVILDQAPKEKLSSEAQKIIEENNLSIVNGEKYLEKLSDFDMIIRSPGIAFLAQEIQVALRCGTEVTSSTKLFFHNCLAKIIGVTGTKGKGTTASLIFEIIRQGIKNESDRQVYLIGNIGNPSFDIIEKINTKDLVVFELSSFQLQDLDVSPTISVVTNLTEDHLDYHKSLEEYRDTKKSVLKYQGLNDFAVINYDYPESRKLENIGEAKKYFFSSGKDIDEGAYVDDDGKVFLTIDRKEKICSQSEIKLIGRHNLENIASAIIVGKLLDVDLDDISYAVKNFAGLPHRLELVKEVKGVKFYNDSFSTNPTPTIAAIKSFSNPITLILGGSEKGADFSELSDEIKKSSVEVVVTIGVEGPRIAKSIRDLGTGVEIIESESDIDGIVSLAFDKTKTGGIVLFSPACASFDMFKNYKDRGESFTSAVNKL